MLSFRGLPHVQGLLPRLYQREHERLFSRRGFLQPLCRIDAEGVPSDDAFHEAARFQEMYRHHVRGQYHDPCLPQCPEVHEQGFRRIGKRRERNDGMVPWLQAPFDVQRLRRNHNFLPDKRKRGRQGREGMAGFHQGTLRESVRRQGIYQERTLRVALRPRNISRARNQGQHEEQTHAHVGQDHAS